MSRRGLSGFTLVELLVVVLILAILMTVALPLYLSAAADSQKKTCRANMQTIANAVQAAYVRQRASGYATYLDQEVDEDYVTSTLPDLGGPPDCPATILVSRNRGHGHGRGHGSTALAAYSIVESPSHLAPFAVICNHAPAHGLFEPGVDSH